MTVALLFVSRMLVKRIEAETSAARQKHIVGLLLREFESNANDWLWESDRDGVLSRVGPGLARMLGRGDAALLGKRLDTLFARQRLIVVASDREVGTEALRRRLGTPMPFAGVVVEAATAETCSWKISARPLHAPSGAWTGWRGVGCDVSDARLREAEALQRERHLVRLAASYWRRWWIAFEFGDDVNAIGPKPGGSVLHLKGLQLIRDLDEQCHRNVGRGETATRQTPHTRVALARSVGLHRCGFK